MTSDKVELMLETLTKAQNQLVTYLAMGFFCGFTLGVVAAWLMFSIAR